MEIRYHLDENVTHAIAGGLRRRGIDVTTTDDAALMGATDEQQLNYALAEGRVLVTHDDDFLSLHAAAVAHAGIGFAPPRKRTIGQIIQSLVHLWRTKTSENVAGTVVFL